jgi:FtsZ-binding cell division protein ZapB
MKGKYISLEEKVARLTMYISLLKEGKKTKDSAALCKVPLCTLRVLERNNFVTVVGKLSSLKVTHVEDISPDVMPLVVDEIWKETRIPSAPRSVSSMVKVIKNLPETLTEPLPPLLPHTLLEKVSHHIAAIASDLGLQCSGKTPPGMAQVISKLQMENGELRGKNKKLEQDLFDAQKRLRRVAQNMRDQAEKFEKVGDKINVLEDQSDGLE